MRTHLLLAASLAAMITGGCAGTKTEGFVPARQENPNYGIAYFYNPAESGHTWTVDVDRTSVGDVPPGHYAWRELSPASHRIVARLGDGPVRQYVLGVDRSRDYFVTFENSSGSVVVQDRDVGEREIAPLSPVSSWGNATARLQNVHTERRGRLAGEVESDAPVVVREPRIVWFDIAELFNHRCNTRVVYRFRLDTSGFPHDVTIENRHEFNDAQVAWARDYFEGFRFRAFRENGKRVARTAVLPVTLEGPEGYCSN